MKLCLVKAEGMQGVEPTASKGRQIERGHGRWRGGTTDAAGSARPLPPGFTQALGMLDQATWAM